MTFLPVQTSPGVQVPDFSKLHLEGRSAGKPPRSRMMVVSSSMEDLKFSYSGTSNSDGESSEGESHRIHDDSNENASPNLAEQKSSKHAEVVKRRDEFEDEDEYEDEYEDEQQWSYPEEKFRIGDLQFGVDARDFGTADDWVERHPSMVRLTGRHPFNAEPPLCLLMQYGFLTPASLHYVRNHGMVPRGQWNDWQVKVGGSVRWPTTFSMQDLVTKFPAREFPCTLVCAGNRRKEENMVAQTIGFNWGAAGVGTSLWKGVLLRDVLRYCGVLSRKKGAHYVCFEGAETLPAAGGSKYGTSVPIEKAMNEANDIIIAYQQNGRHLLPDHGFPVRMIIPGHIGGRMVKWLTSITVTDKESQNHYHFNDNRVLPPHVDAEKAKAEGWFYKPEYIINELNINSAITTPAHDEVLPFDSSSKSYTVKGYAYTGGGRKITRVEVSLDAGETWRLCQIFRSEKPTKHGKYWCWIFWEINVDVTDFLQAREMVVRAWDEALNSQSDQLTWNLMGMMNNCWFRVKIHACRTTAGGIGLNFEHPTMPGNQPGGWMAKIKKASDQQAQPDEPVKKKNMTRSPSMPQMFSTSTKQMTMRDVRKHTHSHSAWIVVHGSIYDCTGFLQEHPGGADSILIVAGTDATEEFDAIHSEKAKKMLEKYKIGELVTDDHDTHSTYSTPESSLRGGNNFKFLSTIVEQELSSVTAPVALNPRERVPVKLVEKEKMSEGIYRFRFALQSPQHILGLPTGKHVMIGANIDGKLVMRAYTPISCDKDVGYFELLMKIYYKNAHFPAGGLMSQHLESLQIGDSIMVKGPIGHIHYQGKGQFTIHGKRLNAKRIAMIAGGTGITPMYQIIRAIMEDREDPTQISLVYGCRTEADVMLKNQLDVWEQEPNSRLRVWYTVDLSEQKESWKYSVGRITEDLMREHIPYSHGTYAFICGPPIMESICLTNLQHLGYDRTACFTF